MTYFKFLRVLGIIEGISTLVLFFIAMPMKYYADIPIAVTISGSIHGFLFLALVAAFLIAIKKVPISNLLAGAGIVGAVVPFGPFIIDHWLKKAEPES
ncbi:MAG: integral membrane protein [Verrucomicrobiales bacterium]|jgi:integral membrane protein